MFSLISRVVFNEMIKFLLPKGWFLKVTPGTSKITVGGAIASDVHGKNHVKNGSFGDHLINIVIYLEWSSNLYNFIDALIYCYFSAKHFVFEVGSILKSE